MSAMGQSPCLGLWEFSRGLGWSLEFPHMKPRVKKVALQAEDTPPPPPAFTAPPVYAAPVYAPPTVYVVPAPVYAAPWVAAPVPRGIYAYAPGYWGGYGGYWYGWHGHWHGWH
jgi:hypothetical protein